MGDTWFTSDTHFGHANIIKYSNRPFTSVKEMDEAMIANWNALVKPSDIVWHLGDFAFSKDLDQMVQLFGRLNGVKCLIRGNHDHSTTRRLGWYEINSLTTINLGTTPVVLCHYALRVWDRSHRGAIHLYGHTHGTLPGDNQSIDVGVDCWDYKPVNIEQIRARLITQLARPKEF